MIPRITRIKLIIRCIVRGSLSVVKDIRKEKNWSLLWVWVLRTLVFHIGVKKFSERTLPASPAAPGLGRIPQNHKVTLILSVMLWWSQNIQKFFSCYHTRKLCLIINLYIIFPTRVASEREREREPINIKSAARKVNPTLIWCYTQDIHNNRIIILHSSFKHMICFVVIIAIFGNNFIALLHDANVTMSRKWKVKGWNYSPYW